MHSQTLQALRSEIEAVATMQNALQRIGKHIDEKQVRVWHGPGPDDVNDYADDDGAFSRDAVSDLRVRAGQALAERYREVSALVASAPMQADQLRSVLHSVMSIGTGVTEAHDPAATLEELATEGAIRLERAVEASNVARAQLENGGPSAALKVPKKAPRKTATKTKKAAAKKPVAKKPAAKKPAAKKPAAKKKAAPKAKKAATKPAAKAKAKAKKSR